MSHILPIPKQTGTSFRRVRFTGEWRRAQGGGRFSPSMRYDSVYTHCAVDSPVALQLISFLAHYRRVIGFDALEIAMRDLSHSCTRGSCYSLRKRFRTERINNS